jgi:hypothetical protein
MLEPKGIDDSTLGELRSEVLKQAKIELRINRSLIEMLKGNTPLEDLANLRAIWIEPLERLVRELRQ